jgi:hypothetical protein
MAMPPIWIESNKVDSRAMLSAYLYRVQPSDIHYGYLKMVSHKMIDCGGTRLTPPAVREEECSAPECQRCREGRGGYQFRWYSPLWEEVYVRLARPGAWMPGDATE